jgi:ABC-type nitrate/sulfonate/bicarbonate transport system ATPase subunit
VRFGDGPAAVDRVELTVQAGEIVSLIGPSGCGKTTLLRSIAGLQALTAGGVEFRPPARAREGQIGFVFQQPALLPWASTLENVILPLELVHRGTPRQRRDAAIESLAAVKLADALDKRPDELSGGMRMRASIARALVTDPGVLLLDEPFAALDDMLRHDLGRLLLKLWQSRKFTAVMVTHNIAESIWLSHRIAVMRAGGLEIVIDNPLPWPRDPGMMRSPEFAEFYGFVSDRLRGEGVLS